MTSGRQDEPGDDLLLKLTAIERDVVLDELTFLDQHLVLAVRNTPRHQPVRLNAEQLDGLAEYVAAELVLTKRSRVHRCLSRVYKRIVDVREEYSSTNRLPRMELAEWSQPGPCGEPGPKSPPILSVGLIRKKPTPGLRLTQWERESMIHATRLRPAVKQRLAEAPYGTQFLRFSIREMLQVRRAVEKAVPLAFNPHKRRLQGVMEKIATASGVGMRDEG